MIKTTRRAMRYQVGLLGGLGVLLLQATPAFAESPVVVHLANGVDAGPMGENGGAGHEQASVTTIVKGGQRYVVTVYMSSKVSDELGPWQCKCSSVVLDPMTGPQMVADQVLLTENENTDRPCNHPYVANDGEHMVFVYGYAPNGGNTQSYAQLIDPMCGRIGDKLRFSNNNNNNQGAPEVQAVPAAPGYFAAGYYDNNDAETYARGLMINSDGQLENGYLNVVVNPSNIGRPTIAVSGDMALLCAAKGDQRPPEDGVACAGYNAMTGELYFKNEVVAASEPGNQIYMNQPSLALVGPGRFALQAIESTGMGKNTNVKGGSKSHIYMLEPTMQGPGMQTKITGLGVYQTHSAIVAGKYSDSGKPFIGLFEAAITGSGVPALTFVDYDSAAGSFNPVDTILNQWVVGGTNSDSGYLANIYGGNPGDQGRDFLRGIGDVPNPGDGIEGGFKPSVKSFFVLPYAGKANGEEKNGLYLSFMPGHTNVPVQPEAPEDVDPEVVSGGATGGSTVASTGPGVTVGGSDPATTGGGATSGGGNTADDPATTAPPATSGCACSTEGSSSSAPAGGLLALGIALLGLSRRRNRKES